MNTGSMKVQPIEEMAGLSFALKFFDDDFNVYVSPEVFEKIRGGGTQVRYMIMSWRTDQITIQDAAKDIINRIEQYGKETGQIN